MVGTTSGQSAVPRAAVVMSGAVYVLLYVEWSRTTALRLTLNAGARTRLHPVAYCDGQGHDSKNDNLNIPAGSALCTSVVQNHDLLSL